MHDDHHHHDHRWDRNWRRFEAMARRGFGRFPGMGKGDWDGFGENFRIGRMLASGDLRLVALYLIEQQPRHGYDLIKAIEEKTAGLYVPSPGVIYPALTFLEEANYVTSVAEANKRLYTITDEGKAHLADNRTAVETTLAHLAKIGEQFGKVRERWEDAERSFRDGPPPRPDRDMDDVAPEVNDARRELKDAIKHAAKRRDPHSQHRLAEILRRAAHDIRHSGDEPEHPPEVDIDL